MNVPRYLIHAREYRKQHIGELRNFPFSPYVGMEIPTYPAFQKPVQELASDEDEAEAGVILLALVIGFGLERQPQTQEG